MPLRAFLPTVLGLFFVLAFALPLGGGRARSCSTDRGGRSSVVGVAFAGLLVAAAAWVALVAALGPASLGVATFPGAELARGAGEALIAVALAVVVAAQSGMGARRRAGGRDSGAPRGGALERAHGDAYLAYAARVGRFAPGVGRLAPSHRLGDSQRSMSSTLVPFRRA
jgi:protein-S-isoprenylcysteine O-methyltransferase Ste14